MDAILSLFISLQAKDIAAFSLIDRSIQQPTVSSFGKDCNTVIVLQKVPLENSDPTTMCKTMAVLSSTSRVSTIITALCVSFSHYSNKDKLLPIENKIYSVVPKRRKLFIFNKKTVK